MKDDGIKQKLTPEEYEILRKKGTEKPFSSDLLYVKGGMFSCKVCGQQLFDSKAKFDSGTGWPSFDQAIPGSVKLNPDHSHNMTRTEVVCDNCDSHLGHVFNDLSQPTSAKAGGSFSGKRFCINGLCLIHKK